MRSEQEAVMDSANVTLSAACAHHWVIETPAGPVSHGRCKLCGEEREFRNSPDNAFYWEDDASRKASSPEASAPVAASAPSDGMDD